MKDKKTWICTNCGYASSNRFNKDICPKCGLTFWQCISCGYTVIDSIKPLFCQECGEKLNFVNITCYIPEWNGPEYAETDLS